MWHQVGIHSIQDATGRSRGCVGDLKLNRKLEWKGRTLKATELAAEIPFEDRQELRRGDKRQYYFTCAVRIPNVNHKVRSVILWKHERDMEPCKVWVTNRINWEVNRILGVYRYRWTGTETFHRNGRALAAGGEAAVFARQSVMAHIARVTAAVHTARGGHEVVGVVDEASWQAFLMPRPRSPSCNAHKAAENRVRRLSLDRAV